MSRAEILTTLSDDHEADIATTRAELGDMRCLKSAQVEMFKIFRQQIDAFEKTILSDYEQTIARVQERLSRLTGEPVKPANSKRLKVVANDAAE